MGYGIGISVYIVIMLAIGFVMSKKNRFISRFVEAKQREMQ